LTAVVSSVAPGAGNATGTITFFDGTFGLVTQPLAMVNGVDQATFVISSLAPGVHHITAFYSGDWSDTNFFGSTSPTLVETVGTAVVGTHLFYQGSPRYDTTGTSQTPLPFSDDNAIAPDKTAYLPGSGSATFANVSSYTRGINGIMVDVAGSHGTLSASDFIFKVGNNNSPGTWSQAPAPLSITTRAGAGAGGSDRVEIIWADGAVQKKWLEVVLKGADALGSSDTNTGLATSYVFDYGSAPGDTGSGDSSAFVVDSTDGTLVLTHPHNLKNPATISDTGDFNRDGTVDSSDGSVVLSNSTTVKTALVFLNVGAGGPFAPQDDPAALPADVNDETNMASALVATLSASPNAPNSAAVTAAPAVSTMHGESQIVMDTETSLASTTKTASSTWSMAVASSTAAQGSTDGDESDPELLEL
jgi:hypothetical protein